MEKLMRDGKVAVVLSQGYGAGWSSWNDEQFQESLAMDKRIAEAVLSRNFGIVVEIARSICGESFYEGGADGLTVVWVDVGTAFSITDYDGHESVVLSNLTA